MMKVIILRILKQSLRERSNYLYFLAFPVLMMMILGTILQNQESFQTEAADKIEPIHAYFMHSDSDLGKNFAETFGTIKDDYIQFEETKEKKTELDDNSVMIDIDKKVDVTVNQLDSIQMTILRTYLEAFSDHYQLYQSALTHDALQQLQVPLPDLSEELTISTAQVRQLPTSFQYFAIAMMGLFILYVGEIGLDMFGRSRNARTGTVARELQSPISRQMLINGTFLGHLIVGLVIVTVLMLITGVLFNAPWGNELPFSFLMLSSLMALFLTLGFFFDSVGNGALGSGLMQILIQIFAFFGGAYFPVPNWMTNFSPLGWVITALQNALWTTNELTWWPIAANLALVVILFSAASLILNKREVF
ncbi:ABC-2 type transport system permease [Enterococcus sp. DIV0213j]|jgi:ABC-2 type transport system permease protein